MDKIRYDSISLDLGSLNITFKIDDKSLVTSFIEMLYGSRELEFLHFDNSLIVKKYKVNVKKYTYCFDEDCLILGCDNVKEIKYNCIDAKIGDVNISLDYKENREFFDSFYDNSNRAELKLYNDKAILVDKEIAKGNNEFEINYITRYGAGAVRKCKGIIKEYKPYFTSYEYVTTINLNIEEKECNNSKLNDNINMNKNAK